MAHKGQRSTTQPCNDTPHARAPEAHIAARDALHGGYRGVVRDNLPELGSQAHNLAPAPPAGLRPGAEERQVYTAVHTYVCLATDVYPWNYVGIL